MTEHVAARFQEVPLCWNFCLSQITYEFVFCRATFITQWLAYSSRHWRFGADWPFVLVINWCCLTATTESWNDSFTLWIVPNFRPKWVCRKRGYICFRHMPAFFTARLRVMQRTVLQGLSVRLYVCLSDKRVDCDKTEETSVQILIPHERSFILVFWQEEWLVEGDPFYLKFWAKLTIGAKTPIFNRYSLVATQP